jgi:hypothetical protein
MQNWRNFASEWVWAPTRPIEEQKKKRAFSGNMIGNNTVKSLLLFNWWLQLLNCRK